MSPILSHLSQTDPILAEVIRLVGPSRLTVEPDTEPFQALAHAIAHQQLHATAATSILRRFIETCGAGVFPTAQQVLSAQVETLRGVGFSGSKIAALKDLAQKTLEGVVPARKALHALEDLAIIERLTQVRGIGRWTVEMMLIFQLGRPDILPVDDFGVRKGFQLAYGLRAMPHTKALAAYGERWAPYRSTVAWYLWRVLDLKKAGTLPVPAGRIRMPRVRKPVRRKKTAAKKTSRTPRLTPAKTKSPRATATRRTQRASVRRRRD